MKPFIFFMLSTVAALLAASAAINFAVGNVDQGINQLQTAVLVALLSELKKQGE